MKLWQKCPVCNGSGMVGGGFFGCPGSIDRQGNRTWAATDTIEMCRVCQGRGIIQTPEQTNSELEVEG